MGKKRFTVKALEEKWAEYKTECDKKVTIRTEFSQKESNFVTGTAKGYVTYTIEGFCVYLGLSRQAFYKYYRDDPKYVDIVTRMREECEVDARQKFEMGQINSRLAGLWMTKYEDYRQKTEVSLDSNNEVTYTFGIASEDESIGALAE